MYPHCRYSHPYPFNIHLNRNKCENSLKSIKYTCSPSSLLMFAWREKVPLCMKSAVQGPLWC